MKKDTKIVTCGKEHRLQRIKSTDDPKEAEYLAKVLINDAHDRKLSASCKKLFKGIFAEYYKEVKLKGGR